MSPKRALLWAAELAPIPQLVPITNRPQLFKKWITITTG